MKVVTKPFPETEWIPYGKLVIGEVYYSTGSAGFGSPDGALYLVTDDMGLVDIINGFIYSPSYGSDALRKWLYKKANVELVEYTNVSD